MCREVLRISVYRICRKTTNLPETPKVMHLPVIIIPSMVMDICIVDLENFEWQAFEDHIEGD